MPNYAKATMGTPRSHATGGRSGVKPGAILLMGLPGAGKGTQAFRLAAQFPNFVHFDTGGEIYRRVSDPHFAADPLVQEQKEIYFGGKLNTPEWVAGLVAERIHFYSDKNQGVIFSGSPRTLYEAEAILPILEECYGRERILVIEMKVSPETARERSLNRITCTKKGCRYPAHRSQGGKPCPNCGQLLPESGTQADEQWKIAQMGTRLKEYEERTKPALKFLKYELAHVHVNAEIDEESVFAKVLEAVKRNLE